jgi:hypothetical protein
MSATGRPPRVRENYVEDAEYMLILSRAINADVKRPRIWRNAVCESLGAIATALLKAPAIAQEDESEKVPEGSTNG